jgi:DEAD/DEAH box helicase
MFGIAELSNVTGSARFRDDYSLVRTVLSKLRLGQEELFGADAAERLSYFVETVLASAPTWESDDTAEGLELCRIAAEISEVLAVSTDDNDAELQSRARLRAALLYELAGQPALASALISEEDVPGALYEFFARRGPFRALGNPAVAVSNGHGNLAEYGLTPDVLSLAKFLQGQSEFSSPKYVQELFALSKEIAIGLSATELQAFTAAFARRVRFATRSNVADDLFEDLALSQFPAELWQSQRVALQSGLLNSEYNSWGIAAPTGTGKTFLSRLLIIDTLEKRQNDKVLYIVPNRALVYEVEANLKKALAPFGYQVTAVTPQLVETDDEETERIDESAVLVLTPEKADMLLRIRGVFEDLALVIIDEAHHIESSTRGILLEMYLWRLKTLTPAGTRFVFLSAVAPNIKDIVRWMGDKSNSAVVEQRPTRMRAGVYEITGTGRKAVGHIEYTDGTRLQVFPGGTVESGQKRRLIQLTAALRRGGPVLVVAKGKGECETLAQMLADFVQGHPEAIPEQRRVHTELLERLDSRLEREMYASVPLRLLVKRGIAYHHAGLPPRVRIVLEDCIRSGDVHVVFATTTLAEGVNFPFSTVLVQSLALREPPQVGRPSRYHPITPRVFWNLAGRAGRPFFDKEGQVILFGPSLGMDKIKAVISDYLNPKLTITQPVVSALATSLSDISELLRRGDLSVEDLSKASLPTGVPNRVRGAINNIRVSLLHARASHLTLSPEEIVEGTFAHAWMQSADKKTATELFRWQDQVVDEFLHSQDASMGTIAAEVGLSIETLVELHEWVLRLEDWQFANLRRVMFGGQVNDDQAKYILGPVAARMAELEGNKLGGLYSEIILQWLLGVPFAAIRPGMAEPYLKRVEDLISVIYSRVQYLLPWGLYAVDRLIEVEARRRKMNYDNELRSLAYLVDAGVPSFDALRLVHTDFERTDAARIASVFHRIGGMASTGTDIVAWLANQPFGAVVAIVRGRDNRKPDVDLRLRLESLASEIE